MTWTKSFQVDVDSVQSKSVPISSYSISDNRITFVTSAPHSFEQGGDVQISGIDDLINGTYLYNPTDDTGGVGLSPFHNINNKVLSSNQATITTRTAHGFIVGDSVSIRGVDTGSSVEIFNGNYTITAVTTNTFTYSKTHADVDSTEIIDDNAVVYYGNIFFVGLETTNVVSTAVTNAYATSPPPSFVRYPEGDTLLDAGITSLTNFYAEPWDYNSIRIVWSLDPALHGIALDNISNGLVPKMVITRSSFGYPVTPLDGTKIIDVNYNDSISYLENTLVIKSKDTATPEDSNDWNRPWNEFQGLYDRNLTSGRWYYYTLFFYLKGENDLKPHWVMGGSMNALVPINYHHADKLYAMVPPYYRSIDSNPQIGSTNNSALLERFIKVIGFEADYTRTLAEGVENIYNIDQVHDDLLHALGETTLGVNAEDGLGDIRYRGIIASINNLYESRGNRSGLLKAVRAATKYNSKVIEGINILNLADDSEFSEGTGAWSDPTINYSSFINDESWLEADAGTLTFNPVDVTLGSSKNSLSIKQGAMEVSNVSGTTTNPLLLTCGLGTGVTLSRLHKELTTEFYPRLNGIKCSSGDIYEFSFYSLRTSGTAATAVSAGIMWFSLSPDNEFQISRDFISKDDRTFSGAGIDALQDPVSSTTMIRYYVQSESPISHYGDQFVYGVPYISFSNSSPRIVSNCMFNAALNTASSVALNVTPTLTLGDITEFLGDPHTFIGNS
jgi:hypothetical protein